MKTPDELEMMAAHHVTDVAMQWATGGLEDKMAATIAILARALEHLTPGYTHRLFDKETRGE